MSIFHTPAPSKVTPDSQAIGSLTGRKDPPPTDDRGESVRHVPNGPYSGGRK